MVNDFKRESLCSSRLHSDPPARPCPSSFFHVTGGQGPGPGSIRAASFEGETVAKKGARWNTASNRVNCAAYAFISLFRNNLLIVSTKRDNPLVDRVSRPVFRWARTH